MKMRTCALLLCLIALLGSCIKQVDLYHDINQEKESVSKDDFFDFSTVGSYTINIDFGYNYEVLFYLYDSYPF